MMWFGMLHLVLVNAIIGVIESKIVSKFKISNKVSLIIIANYVSMFNGLYYIAPHFSTIAGNHDFWGGRTRLGDYKVKGFVIGMLSSYFATLVIEFPFFYLAVKDKLQRKNIFFPFFIANTVTNIAMIFVYYCITGTGENW